MWRSLQFHETYYLGSDGTPISIAVTLYGFIFDYFTQFLFFFRGILWGKAMDNDKLIYVPNEENHDYSFCKLNYWLKRLDIANFETTNQNQ